MKPRWSILMLVLALLALSACARLGAAQSVDRAQGAGATKVHPTATEDTQLLTNDVPGGTPTQAEHRESLAPTQELAGNLFSVLLGPVRTPVDSSVRPCSGEASLLCVYQGRTLLGSVKLVTFPLARDLGLQKMLGDAGIPLGSVDYTDPENASQVRMALTAHAATDLGGLARDRGATYTDKGYTFKPVASAKVYIGNLPGVAYGFTGYDREGRVFERWLSYAALDNHVLYVFGMFYAGGAPESFLSDEDLVYFEPYLRQILDYLWLPVGEDWHSPGAGLPPQGPLLVVQKPDDSIQYVTLDGWNAILVAEAPSSLLPSGYSGIPFGGAPMMDGPIVYVRQLWGGFYALDRIMGQLFPLDFVPPPSPVAVRPLTEGLWPPEDAPISLAWGEFSASHVATATLYLSAPDGSQAIEALRETYGASDPPAQFVPWRWREDGQLFFTKQPVEGMGGFLPFVGAANLWLFDPQSGDLMELVSHDVTGGRLCLDAIAPDDRVAAHHCENGQITLLDLETGKSTAVSLPAPMQRDVELGSVRFSPDGSRVAFAAMTGGVGLLEETRGYIAISDSLNLSGVSRLIVTSEPGEWFSITGWLSADRLILQSHPAGPNDWPAVWTVRTDGSGLIKLAEGTLLAKLDR